MKRVLFIAIPAVVVVVVVLVFAWLVPYVKEKGIRRNESCAIKALRAISSSQEHYNTKEKSYTSLARLADYKYISRDIANADALEKAYEGYWFECVHDSYNWWCCTARPVVPGETGRRFFRITTAGVIYYNTDGSDYYPPRFEGAPRK